MATATATQEKKVRKSKRASHPKEFPCGCSSEGVRAFSLTDGRKLCKCGKMYKLAWIPAP